MTAASIAVLLLASAIEPLTRGLDSIRVNAIRADIHYIASDEMCGRDTISMELRMAARFLKDRIVQLGFQPGNGDQHLHEYPLTKNALDPHSLSASIDGTKALNYGTDYTFTEVSSAEALRVSGDVIYCGCGERDHFDAVAGSWALCDYSDQNIYRLRGRARQSGALGLVLAPTGKYHNLITHFSGRDNAVFEGSIHWPRDSRRHKAFPVIALSEATSADLGFGPQLAIGTRLPHKLSESRYNLPGDVMAENVVGFWPGSDLEMSKEVIIVSAHYDHLGTLDDGRICNGADDNASGTTCLLALAGALKEYGPLRRSILVIWVSGEEKGRWGSKAWIKNPSLPEGYHPAANLNIDTIGRNAPNSLFLTPSNKHAKYNRLTALAERFASEEGFENLHGADSFYSRSDHSEFAKLDIPVCLLFAGLHEDYHKPTDTPDKVDCDKIRRVTRLLFKMLVATDGLNF